jgi:peptide/nickel transport system substrate-binding protein
MVPRSKALKRALSLLASASLMVSLTGCSTTSGLIAGSTVTLGELGSSLSLNTDVASADASGSAVSELSNLTCANFYSIDAKGELSPNLSFGSVTVTKLKPFTVKYLLTDKAQWSDGEAISATDLLLSWAAATNFGGVKFGSTRFGGGLSQASGVPKIGDKNQSLTIEFGRPVADYKTALSVAVAAHSLARIAFPSEKLDSKAASDRVLAAIQSSNSSDLKSLAKSYRLGFLIKSNFVFSKDLAVSSGAYEIVDANSGVITLKAKSTNSAMPGAKAETIKLALYSSPLAMVADLKSGKLDLASLAPNATESNADITAALKQTTVSGVTTALVGTNSVEALIFNQSAGSSFATSSYGAKDSSAAATKALSIRLAFENIVSTSKVQALIRAFQPVQDAKSFAFTSDSSYYQSTIQDSGILAYQFADVQKAYNTLRKLKRSVPVRVLFDGTNPRAQIEYSTIAEKAHEAGFGLSNVSSNDPAAAMLAGQYDVYLAPIAVFGGASSSLEKSLAAETSAKGASDTKIGEYLSKVATSADAVTRAAWLKKIDGELVAEGFGLPLYQLPTIVASSSKFARTPILVDGSSLTAGYATWKLAAK